MKKLFLLDSSTYKPSIVLEHYTSYIWTERFTEASDFEIRFPLTYRKTSPIGIGSLVIASFSHRIMRVNKISISSGEKLELVYSGECYEKFLLENRSAYDTNFNRYIWYSPNKYNSTSALVKPIQDTAIKTNICFNPRYLPGPSGKPEGVKVASGITVVSATSDGMDLSPNSTTNSTYAYCDLGNQISGSSGQYLGIQTVLSRSSAIMGTPHGKAGTIEVYNSKAGKSVLSTSTPPNTALDHYVERLIVPCVTGTVVHSDYQLRFIVGATTNNGDLTVHNTIMTKGSLATVTKVLDEGYFDGDSSWFDENKQKNLTFDTPSTNLSTFQKFLYDNTITVLQSRPLEKVDVAIYETPSSQFPAYNSLVNYTNLPLTGTYTYGPESLWDVVMGICKLLNVGVAATYSNSFSLTSNANISLFCYSGMACQINNGYNSPIIFGEKLNNWIDNEEVITDSEYKNIAIVYGQKQPLIFDEYGNPGPFPDILLNKRQMMVIDLSSQSSLSTEAFYIAAKAEAVSKLSIARREQYLDGTAIIDTSKYVYEKDFGLGTKVSVIDSDFETHNGQIIEYIFSLDRDGEKEYPTIDIDYDETDNTWRGYDGAMTWDAETQTWSEK